MRILMLLPFVFTQASPEAERLWADGERLVAIERMTAELEQRPGDQLLRLSLVQRELLTARFEAALAHSEGLPVERRGLRGRALYFLTRYAEALDFLGDEDPDELLMRAEALRALGRLEEVDALLPRLRAVLGPERVEVRLLEARGLLRRGQSERALELLRGVLREAPLEAEALFTLGRALVRAGKREEGLKLLERHRELVPLLDRLDFARRGVALSPRGGANQAALGDAWLALLPHDRVRATAEARAAYTRALQLAGETELVPIALRAARFRRDAAGDAPGAIELLEDVLERREDVRLRVRVSDYLAQAGRPAEALVHLRRALELRPQDRSIEQRIERLEDRDGGR